MSSGALLVRIDNPDTVAKKEQALAAKIAAEAQLANINAGTRAEVTAARKAALERAGLAVARIKPPAGLGIPDKHSAAIQVQREYRAG